MGIETTTAAEALSLAEAKAHLRIPTGDTEDDAYIASLISAAREYAEGYTKRAISTQTCVYTLDSFPSVIDLPRCPVQSVTSIEYVDTDGDTQAVASYQSDLIGTATARLKPAYNASWPDTRAVTNAVTITYEAGYGATGDSPDTVPTSIKQALLLIIGSLYENRENEITGTIVSDVPFNAQCLLDLYRLPLI